MKILLVEDDETLRRTLRRMLSQIAPDAAVQEAATFLEGESLAMEGVDLLFLDVGLQASAAGVEASELGAAPSEAVARPGGPAGSGSGVELLRSLRRKGCAAPAIMLSGYSDVRVVREALEAGALDYIVKSDLDATTLATMVKAVTVKAGAINPGARAIVKRASGRMARRTTIYLDLSVAHALKVLCAKRGFDMSDVVNEALAMHLARIAV